MPYDALINQKAGNLTPSQRKLLDFILEHDEEAVFLNIHELSHMWFGTSAGNVTFDPTVAGPEDVGSSP